MFISTLSLFAYELSLFLTLPIFAFYIFNEEGGIIKILRYLVFPLLAFVFIYFFLQTVNSNDVDALVSKIISSANYSLRKDYYDVFSEEFLGDRARISYETPHIFNFILVFFSACLISFFSILKRYIISAILSFTAVVSPLALGFLGCDVDRWFFLSMTNFSVVVYLILTKKKQNLNPEIELGVFLLVIFPFFLLNPLQYFDGYRPCSSSSVYCVERILGEFGRVPKR